MALDMVGMDGVFTVEAGKGRDSAVVLVEAETSFLLMGALAMPMALGLGVTAAVLGSVSLGTRRPGAVMAIVGIIAGSLAVPVWAGWVVVKLISIVALGH